MNNLKEGVSLRTINRWLIICAVIFSGFMIYATYRLTSDFMDVRNAMDDNYEMESAVNGMMDASDYLTENVQRFTIDGDRQFMDQYFREALASKRREQALSKLRVNKSAGSVAERLQDAVHHSVKLMDREYYAMRLVIEAKGITDYPAILNSIKLTSEDSALSPAEKMRRATAMVLDEEYYEQKNRIRKEVQNSVAAVEQLTRDAETKAMDSFQRKLNMGRVGIIIQILAIFFVVWLNSSQGINPILKAVNQIKANGPIQETGANEFRYLAKAYNNLYGAYKKNIENLNFKASHDELTGAYNRAGFELLLSGLDLNSTYMMFFDLDNFKSINDSFGHDMGDKALKKLVQVLKKSFRSDDYVCRLGGDEFVVFMVHTDAEQKSLIAKKMEQINKELENTEDGIPPISVSVGIIHGTQAEDSQTLLARGDAAMYESKRQGKHTCTFYCT